MNIIWYLIKFQIMEFEIAGLRVTPAMNTTFLYQCCAYRTIDRPHHSRIAFVICMQLRNIFLICKTMCDEPNEIFCLTSEIPQHMLKGKHASFWYFLVKFRVKNKFKLKLTKTDNCVCSDDPSSLRSSGMTPSSRKVLRILFVSFEVGQTLLMQVRWTPLKLLGGPNKFSEKSIFN